jgi:hypothetical protein
MREKIQCYQCEQAKYGEEIYKYDGELLCKHCVVARVCETTIPCEYYGECNEKKKLRRKLND